MKRGRDEDADGKSAGVAPLINQEDAALYDRQIRLWGAASQQRIFEARVLLVGLTGVGAEVVKNLVLAGIGTLTVSESLFVLFLFVSAHTAGG